MLSYISERDREQVGASGRSGGSGGRARPSGGSEEAKLPDGIRGSARDLVCFSPRVLEFQSHLQDFPRFWLQLESSGGREEGGWGVGGGRWKRG